MSQVNNQNPVAVDVQADGAEPFVVELAVRWGDMDVLGHVNNVQIARLFEEARVRAMMAWSESTSQPTPMVVARQEIEFIAPLFFTGRQARCQIWISRIGGKSFDYACVLQAADGGVVALCETTVTTLDEPGGRPAELPPRLLEALRRQTGDPVPLRRRRTQ